MSDFTGGSGGGDGGRTPPGVWEPPERMDDMDMAGGMDVVVVVVMPVAVVVALDVRLLWSL